MTRLFLIITCIVAMCSCQREPSFTVSGTVAKPGMEGKKVYLAIGEWRKDQQLDSTFVTGGKFTFKGQVKELDYCYVVVNPEVREKAIGGFAVIENADIRFDIDADGKIHIGGTPMNDRFQQFLDARTIPQQKWLDASMALNAAEKDSLVTADELARLEKEWGKYRQETETLTYEFVKTNINNPAAWTLLHNCAVSQPVDRQKELLAGANERTLRSTEATKILERIRILEKTAVGQPFTDLQMTASDGTPATLSDYVGKGKYVLVDFWASWCKPCRAEMPHVRSLYKQYKNKGLEIVGVSFDSSKEAWLKAIDELKLPWPHISDLKGWNSAGAKAYAITGIPFTLLLDKDGTILARNLRGQALEKKLAEVLN